MNERKTATARFTLVGLPPASSTSAQVKALRQRLRRADAHPIDYSDVSELADEWFLRAARESKLAMLPAAKPISIKLDEDVLDYFKSEGSQYQTHINALLRAYMQAQCIVQTR